MITNGTRSFVSAVLNRLLTMDIGEICIFSCDEIMQDVMHHEYQMKYPETAGKVKLYRVSCERPPKHKEIYN